MRTRTKLILGTILLSGMFGSYANARHQMHKSSGYVPGSPRMVRANKIALGSLGFMTFFWMGGVVLSCALEEEERRPSQYRTARETRRAPVREDNGERVNTESNEHNPYRLLRTKL